MVHLSWSEVEEDLDQVEQGDRAGIVAIFLKYEGQALDRRDGRGARQTVNVSTFCQQFSLGRGTFARWLKTYGIKETA
jgi:hypothetical protein